MTTVSGAGEESAVAAWGKTMLALSQKAADEKAAATAAAELANPGSTVVKLSDEAKATAAADDWLRRSIDAINEKARIANAQWVHAVSVNGTDDPSNVYAKFGSASAAEKEAFVQRELIRFDTGHAIDAVIRKHAELTNDPISGGFSDSEIADMRQDRELWARHVVESWSAGPPVFSSATSIRAPAATQSNNQGATPVARVKNTTESIAAAQRAELDRLRQNMGAGSGAANDPAVQKYALATLPGQPSTAELLTAAQQRIDAVQSEFGALAEIWQKAAERGEEWALPRAPDPSADNTGVNTFRYEENHQMYLTNIAYLPLEMARKSLEYGEYLARSDALNGTYLNSHYGDQAINDVQTYITAMKDHISKLENGGSVLVIQPTMKASAET